MGRRQRAARLRRGVDAHIAWSWHRRTTAAWLWAVAVCLVPSSCAQASGHASGSADDRPRLARDGQRPSSWVGEDGLESPYFSKFGDQVLRKSTVIVRGEVVSVAQAPPHSDVVQVRIVESFKGNQTQQVTILANRDEYFVGSELLLFLTEFEQGPRYTCLNRISTSDPDYQAKVDHVERHRRIEQESDEATRREMARGSLLETASSSVKWTRWNMLRELAYVLKKYPDLLRDEDAETLRTVAEDSDDREFADELTALLAQREGQGAREW